MKKSRLRDLWPAFALAACVILGISLRIANLETRDYWYDEAFTGITIRQPIGEMMRIILNDVHPPLYYLLLRVWTLVSGTSPIALRLFSVFFGVATIVLAFGAMRSWAKKSWLPACAAALVVAIDPFFANYSQEARMYTMLGFFILLAAYFLTHTWQHRSDVVRFGYGFCLLAILLTHYVGLMFVVSLVLADGWHLWQQHQIHRKSLKKWLHDLAVAYLLPLLGGLAWLPFFLKQSKIHNTLGWVPNVDLTRLPTSLHIFLFGSPVGVPGVPPALGYRVDWLTVPTISLLLALAVTILVTWLVAKKKMDQTTAVLGFMTVFPLLLTFVVQFVALQLFVERFLSAAALFLVLFLILAISQLSTEHYLVLAVGVYAFLVVLVQPWNYQPAFPSLTASARQALGKETVVWTSPFDFSVARFYLGEQARSGMKIYNVNNVNEDLSTWAILGKQDQIFTLPKQPYLLITPQPDSFKNMQTVSSVGGFSVMKPL